MPKPMGLSLTLIDEKLLQLLISRVEGYAIFMMDVNGCILTWNQGAEKIKGYNADEAIGSHISMFYTDEDRRKNIPGKNLNATLKNTTFETEGWRLKKDGSKFWANVVFTALYDDNGYLAGFAKVTRDVTAKKLNDDQRALINAELERRVDIKTEKVVATERRFRKLIENSTDGISLFDSHFNLFYRSLSAMRITGWGNEERTLKPIEDFVHQEDIASVREAFNNVLQQPDLTVISTYRARHKQGHYFWVECMYTNKLNDPDINAVVCNFRDVTKKVEAEEQIKEQNKQIEDILHSITDGFIAVDKNFNYTYANRKIGEMLGCEPASLIGKNMWDLYPDAVGSDTYKAFYEALNKQCYVVKEDYYPPLKLWQENHVYPSATGLSIFIRDISKRKKAEASLLRSESNLRSVFENTDLAIILFDMEAKLLSFNNNARELSKIYFKRELEIGQSAFYYSPPERLTDIKHIMKQLRNQQAITYEVPYSLGDNNTAWYEARWVSVLNKEDEPVGIILTMKNITDKKQADLERDRMTADLIQRNKDLEQFTYIVSHNLRAPVANIKGLTDLLQLEAEESDKECAAELKALSASVYNLDKVIIDLNNILQTGNASNDTLEAVSLPMLVDEVKDVNGQLISKNNATINCDFNSISQLSSLKSYLYSIFQNLIINSIKYSLPGLDPIINITSKLENNKVCIVFKDNGRGIDMERNGQNIFGLYKRFDLSVEGKGMGLFMVKMQTERLGGKISVSSKLNHGAEFKLEFPLNS
ncbi:PAS domain-containing sensor histidine kinase [Mucilaginibacter terrenus]|uniref:histidine kinase n=1 Tax=Mucilaginibacter terrenus TaxID=2482727 RepID=A0A3E2NV53_9SPHI|nr:PAS domain-containing sensor histidine kinase [Mucilaginibacter terrenus]RFZ84888.1 PAS domain-containing sensor histidine kinase [Mucilaginibacter terrenus]